MGAEDSSEIINRVSEGGKFLGILIEKRHGQLITNTYSARLMKHASDREESNVNIM